MTKNIILTCSECDRTRSFQGETADNILQAIDESGWHDYPSEIGNNINARCPDCQKRYEDAMMADDEWWGWD